MTQSIIGALRVTLGLDSAQFSRGTKEAETSMHRLGRQMRNVGLAASALGTGITLAVRGQLNAADEAIKAAQTVGMSVEQFTRLGHAANLSGVSMTEFQTGVQRMARVMADTPDMIEALGIAVRDADGNLRGTDAVFLDLANVLSQMPDGAEKTAAAMEILGRSGANMIPMLNGGEAALADMMAEADALNLTIGTDAARAAEQFNDNLTRLAGAAEGLTNQITAHLAPALAAISDFVVAMTTRFSNLSPEMQKFVTILAGGLAVGGPVLVGLGLLAMSVTALASPFALAVAGAAALATAATAIYANWDGIVEWFTAKGAELAEWARNLPARLREGIAANNAELLAAVTGLWDIIWTAVSSWPGKMAEAGGNLVRGLLDGILGGRAAAEAASADMANAITGIVEGEFGIQSPSRVFQRIGRFLTEGLALGIRSGTADAVTAAGDMADGVAEAAKKSMLSLDQFASGFANFVGPILRGSQTVRGALVSMFTGWGNRLFSAGLTGFGRIIGGLLRIPSFAGGGWTGNAARAGGLDGQGGFLGMLHPREAVIDTTRGGPGGMGGVVKIMVEAVEGAMFTPRVRAEAQGVAVEVVQSYDRSLPDRMTAIQQDPRARS